MPSQFMRFRYLNDSANDTEHVKYGVYSDKEAQPNNLIYEAEPVSPGNKLEDDEFVTKDSPGPISDARSVKIDNIRIAPNDDLNNWVLTSNYHEEDTIDAVEVLVEPAPNAPGTYLATALLYFSDTTYERRVRFFP